MTAERVPLAERLAIEAPLALGAVLSRAHDTARALEAILELEAADPRVAELHRAAKALRRSIGAVLAVTAVPERDLDCPSCLDSVERCETTASMGGGRCCEACGHV